MEQYLVFKCHINKDRLIYVSSFDDELKARRFIDSKNRRSISDDNPDTYYNYYIMRNIWYNCVNVEV